MKPVTQTFREARALIEAPEHWTRGSLARSEDGKPCDPRSPAAVRWCANGAMAKVTVSGMGRTQAWLFLRMVTTDIVILNDGTDDLDPRLKPRPAPARHRKVLAAFDKAIELAEAHK